MQRHEPGEELADGGEVPVLRSQILKSLIEERAIGLKTGPIESTHASFSPLLDPVNEATSPLEIGPGRGGGRLLLRELPRELVQIDPQPDERRRRQNQTQRRQVSLAPAKSGGRQGDERRGRTLVRPLLLRVEGHQLHTQRSSFSVLSPYRARSIKGSSPT